MAITRFAGPWSKLSNYSACTIWYEGHLYPSIEHAYQAQKSADPKVQQTIRNAPTANVAKKLGRAVDPLVKTWDETKLPLMFILLIEKFSQEPEKTLLESTGDEDLVEGNWWGDRFWGQCPLGTGENWLGRFLMDIRKGNRTHGAMPLSLLYTHVSDQPF